MIIGYEMMDHIIEKASSDLDFRQRLLSDPKATVCEEFDITLTESVTINIHESDMQTVHIALPPNPNMSEEQLEAVSAGACC